MKNEKIDFIKVITLLLVVLAHVTRMYTGYGAVEINIINPVLKFITEYIYGFHMPLFFAMSGFVYSLCIKKGKYMNKIDFIVNKFKRLIIPYLFIGVFYVAPIMIFLNLTDYSFFQFIIKNILIGSDSRHLWYLSSLFIIFIISIVIRPKNIKSSLVAILFSFLLIMLVKNINFIPTIIMNAISYMPYFYIGYCLFFLVEKAELFENNNMIKIITLLLLLLIYSLSFYYKIPSLILSSIGIISFFFLFYTIPERFYKNNRVYLLIKKYNMGIYLFHPMIIYILFNYFKVYYINDYIMVILISFLSLIISLLFSKLFKLLKIDWLLGEK